MVFTCNHCPYALAWHDRILEAAGDYSGRGVRFLAVNPNDAERYPADSLDAMRERVAGDGGWPIPYLRDESQEAAREFGAKTTPGRVRARRRRAAALPRRAGRRPHGPERRTPPGCARRSTRCSRARTRRARRPSRWAAASSGGSDRGHHGLGVGEVRQHRVGARPRAARPRRRGRSPPPPRGRRPRAPPARRAACRPRAPCPRPARTSPPPARGPPPPGPSGPRAGRSRTRPPRGRPSARRPNAPSFSAALAARLPVRSDCTVSSRSASAASASAAPGSARPSARIRASRAASARSSSSSIGASESSSPSSIAIAIMPVGAARHLDLAAEARARSRRGTRRRRRGGPGRPRPRASRRCPRARAARAEPGTLRRMLDALSVPPKLVLRALDDLHTLAEGSAADRARGRPQRPARVGEALPRVEDELSANIAALRRDVQALHAWLQPLHTELTDLDDTAEKLQTALAQVDATIGAFHRGAPGAAGTAFPGTASGSSRRTRAPGRAGAASARRRAAPRASAGGSRAGTPA